MYKVSRPFQPKLPARIAGIVFWVLMLIGLVMAFFLLSEAESNLEKSDNSNVLMLANELELIVQDVHNFVSLEDIRPQLNSRINDLRKDMGFNAVKVYHIDGATLWFGTANDDDDVKNYRLKHHHMESDEHRDISVSVYFPNRKNTIADMRKNMILGIGLGILVFGFLLHRILQTVLTVPFVNMVRTAEDFSLGDETVRFDETRQDEFGYLGGFINNAIESILEQQNDLVKALERASTSEIELNIEKERAEVTLHSITDSVVTVDVSGCVQFINPAAEILLSTSNEEAHGVPYVDLVKIVDESTSSVEKNLLEECFQSGHIIRYPQHSSLINQDAALIAVEASIAPMKNDEGSLMGAVAVIQDVSNTRKLTRQLTYQASHDMLTGLYNRRKFEEHLENVLREVKNEKQQHAVCYMDLDQFKIVNDTCGHIAGDELLQQLPVIFNKVLRSGDLMARLGGDEFGVLLENCNLTQAARVADKIREQIRGFRFVWEDKTFEIGISIGVVGIDEDNCDMATVMSSADIACYAAKDSGRNRVHIYEASDEIVTERYGEMHWTSRITKAMEEGRFVLYQQRIAGIAAGTSDHVEVLLRMLDEEGAIIPPDMFIPAAERYNLMHGIDRWVIAEVFRLLSEKQLGFVSDDSEAVISVNLSGDSLTDDSLLEYIFAQRDKYNVSLSSICFEITETVAISNLRKATAFMEALRNEGCLFALDDFGSGLSSFAYLKSLPVHYLKIDGSFVRDVSRDEIDHAMVLSIQQVGEAMKLRTIAEWVSDEATLQVLKEIGVDYAQGYYMGRPEPIEADVLAIKQTSA